MHRDGFHAEFLCGLPPRVADDDHAVTVEDDRLPEPELLNRHCDRIDSMIVLARVLLVGFDYGIRPSFFSHLFLSVFRIPLGVLCPARAVAVFLFFSFSFEGKNTHAATMRTCCVTESFFVFRDGFPPMLFLEQVFFEVFKRCV